MALALKGAGGGVTPLKDFDKECRSATCDDCSWEIVGTDSQILQVALKPGQCITAEPGVMVFTSYDVKPKTAFAGCCQGASGESLFKTEWRNEGTEDGYVGITGNVPTVLLPINLNDVGNRIYARVGSWIANTGSKKTSLSLSIYNKGSCMAMCCTGVLLMQCIESKAPGTDVWAFLGGYGSIVETEVPQGQTVYVDPEAIIGWNGDVEIDAKLFGDCATCCCSWCCARGPNGVGESPLMLTLKSVGPKAKVWMQSMPIEKVRRACRDRTYEMLAAAANSNNGGGNGGGGAPNP